MNLSPSPGSVAPAPWTVVCLCAEWCGVCRDYQTVFQQMAHRDADTVWHWLDVEDHADVAGDFDVETFPSLLIAHGDRVCFLGPLVPHAPVLERLLQTLRSESGSGRPGMPGGADALWARIQAASLSCLGGRDLHKSLLAE